MQRKTCLPLRIFSFAGDIAIVAWSDAPEPPDATGKPTRDYIATLADATILGGAESLFKLIDWTSKHLPHVVCSSEVAESARRTRRWPGPLGLKQAGLLFVHLSPGVLLWTPLLCTTPSTIAIAPALASVIREPPPTCAPRRRFHEVRLPTGQSPKYRRHLPSGLQIQHHSAKWRLKNDGRRFRRRANVAVLSPCGVASRRSWHEHLSSLVIWPR